MKTLVPPPSTSGKTLMERVEDALLPLINLVFLLLMFFIVAGQLSDTPLPDLPGTSVARDQQSPHADLIVRSGDDWRVGGQSVTRATLLAKLPAPDDSAPLKIAAGKDLAMSDLESLLQLLEEGGYTEVILLTEPAP